MSLEAMRRAYANGYSAGQRKSWPNHKPPVPPDPVIAQLMTALRDLRDATDGQCAMFLDDDEICIALSPVIDGADAALEAVTAWLVTHPTGAE